MPWFPGFDAGWTLSSSGLPDSVWLFGWKRVEMFIRSQIRMGKRGSVWLRSCSCVPFPCLTLVVHGGREGKRHGGAIPAGPSERTHLASSEKDSGPGLSQEFCSRGKLCAAEHSLVIKFYFQAWRVEECFISLLEQLPSCCCCHASGGAGPQTIWWVIAKQLRMSVLHVMPSVCLGLNSLNSWQVSTPNDPGKLVIFMTQGRNCPISHSWGWTFSPRFCLT